MEFQQRAQIFQGQGFKCLGVKGLKCVGVWGLYSHGLSGWKQGSEPAYHVELRSIVVDSVLPFANHQIFKGRICEEDFEARPCRHGGGSHLTPLENEKGLIRHKCGLFGKKNHTVVNFRV